MNAHSTLDSTGWPRRGEDGPAVVALGGGHGLSATLRALRHVTHQLTAVVTVADVEDITGVPAPVRCV